MEEKRKFRYFDAAALRPLLPQPKKASHSEFLRTGRISREKGDWLPDERRYLTYEEVAERTEKKLTTAGETTHERLNNVHKLIRFPKIIFSKALDERPHLGYCHVTTAKTRFDRQRSIVWSFYICNFAADIGEEEGFFQHIRTDYSRMYFAVAMQPAEDGRMQIDRSIRGNGLLFKTNDPAEALKNVLVLGAPDETVREIIRKL